MEGFCQSTYKVVKLGNKGKGALTGTSESSHLATSSAQEDKDEKQILDPVELPDNKKSGERPGCSNTKDDNYQRYIPLYKAAQRGDWETANAFLKKYEGALTAKINADSETALHVAVGAGTSSKLIFFVEKLVDRMPPEALEYRDYRGRTPFGAAVDVGNTEAVKILWERGTSQYRRAQLWYALYTTARSDKKDILLYLLDACKNYQFSQVFPRKDSAAHFLILVIESGNYDIASDWVKKYPILATSKRVNGDFGLKVLSRKVSAFKSGSYHQQGWRRIIYNRVYVEPVTKEESTSHIKGDIEKGIDGPQVTRQRRNWARHLVENFWTFVPCIKHIQDEKKMHLQALKLVKYLCEGLKSQNNSDDADELAKNALLTAAKFGIHDLIEAILESFPRLMWAADEKGINIFHIAIEKRHANVFNLIYRIGPNREPLVQIRDPSGNNLLHLAGKLAPRNKYNLVIGPALQMQRELQWFEEVKKFAKPSDINLPNNNGETPTTTFTHEHEGLRAEGEKWMKDTANSLTVPAALVVTVVFAATITVPGGLNSNGDGRPVFSKEVVFNVFAIFTAISLCTSITSLLVSLSILTSCYPQDDFLFSLPRSLAIALFTLFLSITAMAIAFSSALYIMFGNRDKPLILCLVVAVACIPIIFASLQTFRLLLRLIVSTYCPRIFSKQSDPFF